ncbi:MAG: hypothetical protein ACRC7N_20930 [Clostridium sp.]
MSKIKSINKIYIIIFLVLGFSLISNMSVSAASLEEKIIEQNKQLNESIDEKQMLPDFYTNQYEEINSYSNGHAIDLGSVIMKWVKTITIDGRNVVISIYALYVLVMLIYLGIFGSRDLAKRKRGIISLIGISLVFLLYINIPLIMMYIQGNKSLIFQVSFTDRINSVVLFLQRNSFIIAAILAYVGVTKLIVSKNDLGFKLQGRYLVKFSFILLILLNIVPIVIRVII